MPAPTVATYSLASKCAANAAFLALVDVGSKINVRDDDDVLLATIDLDDPTGDLNESTGRVTFAIAGPATAVATGTAAYCDVVNSDDEILLQVPAFEGTAPISGNLVLITLSVVIGGPVGIVSFTVG